MWLFLLSHLLPRLTTLSPAALQPLLTALPLLILPIPQAALEYFPDNADLHPRPSFASMFDALQTPSSSPHITHAIVPIENSSNGTVVSLLDLLADPENKFPAIKVCAEHYLPVHHCLLAAPTTSSSPSSITTLHTHPQVWTQCTRYLSQHLPHTDRIDTSSTSAAAQHLLLPSTPRTTAAIGSALAASTLGLQIVASNIEDDGGNTTRFLVLCNEDQGSVPLHRERKQKERQKEKQKPKQKSLLTFTLSHSLPGSLSLILSTFSTYNFNLTSIDTRPSRRVPWHYIFCVECEEVDVGSREVEEEGKNIEGEGNFEKMLQTLKSRTETCRYLGSWEDALGR
jgi:prephenate dehydratase